MEDQTDFGPAVLELQRVKGARGTRQRFRAHQSAHARRALVCARETPVASAALWGRRVGSSGYSDDLPLAADRCGASLQRAWPTT